MNRTKKALLVCGSLFTAAVIFVSILHWNSRLHINERQVEKIELVFRNDVEKVYSDSKDTALLVRFFNSLQLGGRYDIMDCQRMSEDFVITYRDGSSDTLSYRFTSILYNGVSYKIDKERTSELDEILYPGLKR